MNTTSKSVYPALTPLLMPTFQLGHSWGTAKSKYPKQIPCLLSLSQLVAPLSTQSPRLQPGEPSLTSTSHLSLIFDYCQFHPSKLFLYPHLCCLGPSLHPFSPGLLQPPSMGQVFLPSLSLITCPLKSSEAPQHLEIMIPGHWEPHGLPLPISICTSRPS